LVVVLVFQTWGSAGSPQSTLWSPLGFGSPDGPSKEPSPPPSPELAEDPFWDSGYDAVGRLEKMNLNDCEKPIFQNIGLCSNQALTDHQLRAIEVIINFPFFFSIIYIFLSFTNFLGINLLFSCYGYIVLQAETRASYEATRLFKLGKTSKCFSAV
jgi:hypothetical protein